VRNELAVIQFALRSLQAQSARWLAVLARRGQANAIQWLVDNAQVSADSAYGQVRAARQLEELPATAEALRSGRIGERQTSVICRAMRKVPRTMDRGQAERELVAAAATTEPAELARRWSLMRYFADQAAGVAAERAQPNYLNLQVTWWGTYKINGELNGETGAAVWTALEPLMRRRSADDQRGAPERRAGALGELATRMLDAGTLPEQAGERPHLDIVTSMDTLQLEPGSAMAELNGRLLVTGETARRLACDATVTEMQVDDEGRVVSVGRRTRTVSPRMRRALNVMYRTCQHAGCKVPATQCQYHHLQHWADGGATIMSNLRPYCQVHHPLMHPENARFRRPGSADP